MVGRGSQGCRKGLRRVSVKWVTQFMPGRSRRRRAGLPGMCCPPGWTPIFLSHLGCWLPVATGCGCCGGCGDRNTKKPGRVQTSTFAFWPVRLCSAFPFPSASFRGWTWSPSLGFPGDLQAPSDLGRGISLLDFSARSSVRLLPPLPPASFPSPSPQEGPHTCSRWWCCFRTFLPPAS